MPIPPPWGRRRDSGTKGGVVKSGVLRREDGMVLKKLVPAHVEARPPPHPHANN